MSAATIKQRNAQFNAKARAGKNPVNLSRQEQAEKRSPIGYWALAAVVFVVLGGGVFELLRLVFL